MRLPGEDLLLNARGRRLIPVVVSSCDVLPSLEGPLRPLRSGGLKEFPSHHHLTPIFSGGEYLMAPVRV